MVAEYKKKVNLYIGGSLIAGLAWGVLSYSANIDGSLTLVVNLLISIVYFSGLYYYAKAKGYSGWLLLLGFLHLLGLIILVVLPDKMKQPKPIMSNAPYKS